MKTGITWIVCAAGSGERFKAIGIGTPKPLISIRGLSMLEWALSSLPIKKGDRLLIVTLRKHRVRAQLAKRVRAKFRPAKTCWVELAKLTSGQLETALIALKKHPTSNPIAIFNCDTYFKAPRLRQRIFEQDGVIPCARAEGRAWSFCKTKSGGAEVTSVAEKKRISPWATVGLYSFRDSKKFQLRAALELKENHRRKRAESFVAPLYNRYIEAHEAPEMLRCKSFKPFGSPEQLKKYWRIEL